MALTPAPLSFVHSLFGAPLLRLLEAPGARLTAFVDDAEEIWACDPLLTDDEDPSPV